MTNYQKLINGKSVFGVVGDGKETVDLGIVIVDDVHTALARTEDQFRLRVPAAHEAYEKLLALFSEDLQYQPGAEGHAAGPVRACPVKDEDLVAVLGHPGPQVHGGDGLVRGLGDHPRRDESGEVVLGGASK
ncbi:hypothetical protein ACWGLF_28005 [Streptomyces puniciscabiei]